MSERRIVNKFYSDEQFLKALKMTGFTMTTNEISRKILSIDSYCFRDVTTIVIQYYSMIFD